jgi:hypothetical protein
MHYKHAKYKENILNMFEKKYGDLNWQRVATLFTSIDRRMFYATFFMNVLACSAKM